MKFEDDLITKIKSNNEHDAIFHILRHQNANIDWNHKDKYNNSMLILAVKNNYAKLVELLLISINLIEDSTIKNSIINAKDDDGNTALILAAHNGHEAVVELLLGHKDIEVNAKDDDGNTALILAAHNGHEAVVELLLDRGADINVNGKIDKNTISAIDLIVTKFGTQFLANCFTNSYLLTYKHSDEYISSKLIDIQNNLQAEQKNEFKEFLLLNIHDKSFALYRLYNLDFGDDKDVQNDIQTSLEGEYKNISSPEIVFYAILHFLEKYLIHPIFRDKEGFDTPEVVGENITTDSNTETDASGNNTDSRTEDPSVVNYTESNETADTVGESDDYDWDGES